MTAKVITGPEAPAQGELFHQSSFTGHLEIPNDLSGLGDTTPVVPDSSEKAVTPVSVDLVMRAEQLKIVTDRLAEINRTRGLSDVLDTPQGERVHGRYKGDAHHILYKAEGIHAKRMRAAKTAFALATGMQQMIDSGLMTEKEAKESTNEDWKQFMKQYADANQPNREKLRRQQGKLVKALTRPSR
ncbi:hypothetical protein KC957_02360 [Candidatus Saccharibacteria bacterium]|nr:hypothetical protein [Candidatus Saccharibacteria bacterium]